MWTVQAAFAELHRLGNEKPSTWLVQSTDFTLRRPINRCKNLLDCLLNRSDPARRKASQIRATVRPVAGSCIFDPSLLLGYQAMHKLGPFFLVGLHTFV
jgi:hypothetical protein